MTDPFDGYRVRWYDIDGSEITVEQANELLADINARRVALTDIDGRAEVSTVLLVLDHSWTPGSPPLIFETMAWFGEREDGDVICERTSNKAAALAMHDRVVAEVRGTLARLDSWVNHMQQAGEVAPSRDDSHERE